MTQTAGTPATTSATTPAYSLDLDLDLNPVLNAIGLGLGHVYVFIIAGIAWAFDAIEVTVIAFLLPVLHCEFGISHTLVSLTASMVFVGMGFGSVFWSWAADKVGRQQCLFASLFTTVAAGLLSAAAPSFAWFLAFRVVLGFGIGGTIPIGTGLFLEYCPVHMRGFWGAMLTAWWAVGSIFGAVCTWLILEPVSWRVLLVVVSLPGVLALPFIFYLDRTPRFLVLMGAHSQLLAVLIRLAHRNKSLEALHAELLRQVVSGSSPSTHADTVVPYDNPEGSIPKIAPDLATATLLSRAADQRPAASGKPAPGTVPAAEAAPMHQSRSGLRLWLPNPAGISIVDMVARMRELAATRDLADLRPLQSYTPVVPRWRKLAARATPYAVHRIIPLCDAFTVVEPPTEPQHKLINILRDVLPCTFCQPRHAHTELQDAPGSSAHGRIFRQQQASARARGNFRDLFSKTLRGTVFRLMMIEFALSLAYYGFELALPYVLGSGPDACPVHTTGRQYIGYMISVSSSFPFVWLGAFLMSLSFLGRRRSSALLSVCTAIGLASLAALIFADPGPNSLRLWFLVGTTTLINGFINGSSAIIQIYMSEVLPTTVRALGVGLIGVFIRIAGAIAPALFGVLVDLHIPEIFFVIAAAAFLLTAALLVSLPFETFGVAMRETVACVAGASQGAEQQEDEADP